MNALMLLLLVSTGQVPGATDWQNWHSDYGLALSTAKLQRKPLLVVLNGADDSGATIEPVSLTRSSAASELLRHYTLCRVDVTTPYGRRVAAAFRAESFPHTVIIDHTGRWTLFKRTGRLNSTDWSATLARYQHAVRALATSSAAFCLT